MGRKESNFKKRAKDLFWEICGSAPTRSVEEDIRKLRQYLKQAGCSLKDINCSEDGLKFLLHNGYKSAAKSLLYILNLQVVCFDAEIRRVVVKRLFCYIKKANLSFSDLGVSEKTLKKITKRRSFKDCPSLFIFRDI